MQTMLTRLARSRAAMSKGSRRTVGLDLDGSFVAAVELDGRTLVRAVSAGLPAGAVVDGEVADVALLAEALRAFFKQHGLAREVRLGVSSQQIVLRQLELPRIADPAEREAAVRFQAAEAIAMPLEEAVLDFQSIGETVGADGIARERLLVVAARESMVAKLVEAVRAAKLRPLGIDLNAFALVRALAAVPQPEDSARVYCHLGGITNLAIAAGGACLFTRPLSLAADAGEESAVTLAEEVRLSIDFYMGQPEARWVGDVVLSGPGSADAQLADRLAELVGLPVSIAEPLPALDAAALTPAEDPRRHTVALGLSMGAAA